MQIAEAAFIQSTQVMQEVGRATEETGAPAPRGCLSRIWTQLPFVASIVCTLITTITAVAAAILGNYPLALMQAADAVVLGFVSYHVYMTIHLPDLEHYVTLFATRIRELSSIVHDLGNANNSLANTEKQIHNQVDARGNEFVDAKEEASKAVHELEVVTAKLAKSEAAIGQMKAILADSHLMMNTMSEKMQGFIQVNDRLDTSSAELGAHIREMARLQATMTASLEKFDHQNGELLEYKRQADQIAHSLFSEFMQMATLLASFKTKEESFGSSLNSLEQVGINISTNTGTLQKTMGDMNEQLVRAEGVLSVIHRVTGAVEKVDKQQ